MSVPQEPTEVKLCSYEGCEEEAFRHGICFRHFLEEERDLDGTACIQPALHNGWWGDSLSELGGNHG
jgi:hypothetical protein